MHAAEKIVFAIRHSHYLERSDRLWNYLRPVYERLSALIARKGLERIINGTDRMLLSPRWRMVSEEYEPEVWRQVTSEAKPGDVVADVGAYIGLYTMALGKRVGSTGTIVAFEPDPSSFAALKHHVMLNGLEDRVELQPSAVGAAVSNLSFGALGTALSSVVSVETSSSAVTPCISLDQFFDERRVDILKIDVEGYEEKVLQGATRLLKDVRRRPRAIFIEVHPYAWPQFGTSSESLLDLLGHCNYRVRDLAGNSVDKIEVYGEVIAYART